MGVWQLLLVGLVMVLGVVGALLPGVPGRWLVWAALLWWSLHERTGLAWVLLVAATALLLVDQVVVWLLPSRRARGTGMSRRIALWAGLGSVAGFLLLPVVGAVPGFLGGIYLAERRRLGGHGEAVASTRAVMRGAGTGALVELLACLLVAGAWLGAVVWG
ncbi:DUF456 domain-containing protein [Streptomyces clavuligerus]|nr:DUF456 domain-containing protein [Streptomyces clavuligerus]ANW17501.1 hypothetical protein BB341_04310 [Streptomyces clavuligerus]AXU12046.1 DUF456 domain-containing protein [Streptomyces clavuligerus]EDY53038.1 conserved hypothetical protein [Streptomyces clavuligerus]MBY6301907.1 DUF456 domain-containing protein [Streptomyces clavuligerus]QCS04827.1 DUF456 domain-containing protein [Streptomyces clavuligerus]